MAKNRIWDIIDWVVLAGISIWLLLKVFGVIHSEAFIEYSPLFGAVYLAGWAMQKLERAVKDIEKLEGHMVKADENTKKIEEDMGKIRIKCPVFKK